MPDNLDQVESKQHMRFVLEFACDKNNIEIDKKQDLNYDKYFKDGDVDRNPLTEFNSNNTELLNVEEVKAKLLELKYIRDEIAEWENR